MRTKYMNEQERNYFNGDIAIGFVIALNLCMIGLLALT